MLATPTSSVTSAESTTLKGMIRIHGTDVWTLDPTLFPMLGLPQQQVKFLLRFATLAPSAYNSQPWRFLVNGSEVALYVDRRYCMVAADPHDRALYLSCGAVLQYLWLAARHYGFKGALNLFPDESNRDLVATFALGEQGYRASDHEEELFQAILLSHTNKNRYNPHLIAPENVDKLVKEVEASGTDVWVEAFGSLKQRKKIGRVVAMAIDVQLADKYFQEEVGRFAHTHVAENDGVLGYKVTDPGLSTFKSKDGSSAQTALELAEGSPLLLIIGTRSDAPKVIVECGMVTARIILCATRHGIAHSWLNQPMMYSALRNRVAAVAEGVEDLEDDERLSQIANVCPQVILRLGYGEFVDTPTPRRSVKEMLIKTPPFYAEP